MLIKPYCPNLLQHQPTLCQFLLECQQEALRDQHFKIANIVVEIDAIDPLSLLHELNRKNQAHFYFEKRFDQEAVVAIASTILFQTDGKSRFAEAQSFIQTIIKHIIYPESSEQPGRSLCFFCAFTFEDTMGDLDDTVPAATVLLPRWQLIRQPHTCRLVANLRVDLASDEAELNQLAHDLIQEFQTIQAVKYRMPVLVESLATPRQSWDLIESHDFRNAAKLALSDIRRHHLNKLVLAHAVDVLSYLPFQWIHCLDNLRQMHPDCYIFSTSQGQGSHFIGASPERLLSIRSQHLVIDALAGSAPRGQTQADDIELGQRLLHSAKERHEHQLVVDFIVQCMQQFDLVPKHRLHPDVLHLSNIQHLHTPIRATLPQDVSPLDILAQLHPTPAIAGLPRDAARAAIAEYEPFARSLYAGALGWVDGEHNSEFIVGIRSAWLQGCRARLFAGAGIVDGSDPDRELAEVRLKLRALLQALV